MFAVANLQVLIIYSNCRFSSSIRLATEALICHEKSTMLRWNDSRK